MDNHREYIEKAIKSIVKVKYIYIYIYIYIYKTDLEKKKEKKLIYYSKQQRNYLRFLITCIISCISKV